MAKPSSSQPKRAPDPTPDAKPAALKAAPPGSRSSAGSDDGGRSNKVARGFGGVVRDILIFGILFVVGLGLYYRHVQTSKEVNHVAKLGKDLAEKDTPQDFYAAEKDLDKVLTLEGNNGYALSSHAELDALLWGEYGVKDRQQAAEDFSRKADATEAPIQERFAAKALILLYSGKVTEAETFLIDWVKKGAHGSHVAGVLGRVERKLGKLDIAKKTMAEAAKDWRTPRYNADLAQIYFDVNDTLNAIGYFEKALQSNPDHPVALIGRARAGIARGEKIKVATDDLASLLGPRKSELTPTLESMALTARAELKMFNRQYSEAIKDARDAVASDRSYAPAYEALGLALTHDKVQAPKSLAAFDQAIRLDPFVATFYYSAAKALLAAGLGDKAIAMMQRLDKSLPRDENYFLIFGDLLDKKGDAAGAMVQYDQAIKVNAFSAPAYFAKGKLLQSQKKYPEAAKAYEAALGAQATFPEVHQQMGCILMDSKKPVDAAGEFEIALEELKVAGAPREKLNALRDNFTANLKKAPKPLQKKFAEDVKSILH